jgi:hypothetical protein
VRAELIQEPAFALRLFDTIVGVAYTDITMKLSAINLGILGSTLFLVGWCLPLWVPGPVTFYSLTSVEDVFCLAVPLLWIAAFYLKAYGACVFLSLLEVGFVLLRVGVEWLGKGSLDPKGPKIGLLIICVGIGVQLFSAISLNFNTRNRSSNSNNAPDCAPPRSQQ